MDLLLIIVFAQFMEFRQASLATRREMVADLERQQQELAEHIAAAESDFVQQRERLERRLAAEADGARAEADGARAEALAATRQSDRLRESWSRALTGVAGTFSAEASPDGAAALAAEAGELGQRLADASPTAMLRFLIGYEELLKRADVWTLHVSDRGDFTIRGAGRQVAFRLERRDQPARASEFGERLRAIGRTFPEPKGLVVILASYSPGAIAGNYQAMIDGLPGALELLKADAGGRTRFEAAVIGALDDPERDFAR